MKTSPLMGLEADKENGMIYRFGDCAFDMGCEELRRAGEVISVEPQALKVLRYLLEHRDRVVTRDELLDQCWPDLYVSDASLTSCLRRVRLAIGQSRETDTLIDTLHRRGYRFVAEVTEVFEADTAVRPRPSEPTAAPSASSSTPSPSPPSRLSADLAGPSPGGGASVGVEGSTILIVDDEPFNVDLLEQILEELGYETLSASNGQEALAQVTTAAPDLILLDIMMPVMDGFTLCRLLKGEETTRLIPIVIMTALDAVEDRIKGIEAGADDFLTKPVDERELLARIQTALRAKHTVDRQLGELREAKDHFAKFVPDAVRRLVAANPQAPELSQRECDASVLILEMTGYSRLADELSPHDLSAVFERYVAAYLDCIHAAGGDLNETVGNGLMAVFQEQPPLFQSRPSPPHAQVAADTALALRAITIELNAEHPHQALDVHIGLNSGSALVGATRFEGQRDTRWSFTASGPMTNLAGRLSSLATSGQILIGPETASRLGDAYQIQKLSSAQLRDIPEAMDIYSLDGVERQ